MTKQKFIDYLKEHDIYGYSKDSNILFIKGMPAFKAIYIYDKYCFLIELGNRDLNIRFNYTKMDADKLIAISKIELEKYD